MFRQQKFTTKTNYPTWPNVDNKTVVANGHIVDRFPIIY